MGAPLNPFRLAEVGAVLAEPARAAILLALLDGAARPAGELALLAGVAPPTASAHLRKLVEAGMLRVLAQGRHRYYRLAGEHVADLLESLALARPSRARRIPPSAAEREFMRARTCYHHVAGALGVALFERLRTAGGLLLGSDTVRLDVRGQRVLAGSGLFATDEDLTRLRGRTCVDGTERRFHLSGALGTCLGDRLFAAGWLRRRHDTRALALGPAGRAGLHSLGIDWDALSVAAPSEPSAAQVEVPTHVER